MLTTQKHKYTSLFFRIDKNLNDLKIIHFLRIRRKQKKEWSKKNFMYWILLDMVKIKKISEYRVESINLFLWNLQFYLLQWMMCNLKPSFQFQSIDSKVEFKYLKFRYRFVCLRPSLYIDRRPYNRHFSISISLIFLVNP